MAKTENIRKTTLEGFGERYRRISPQRCEYQSATEEEFVSILDERDEHPFDLNPRVPMLEVSEKGERKPLTWAYALEISANLVAVIEGRLLRTEVSLFRKESTNRASIVLEPKGTFAARFDDLTEDEKQKMAAFLRDLGELNKIERGHPFQKDPSATKEYVNLYREKYHAAKLLPRMAEDPGTDEQIDSWKLDAILAGQERLESVGFLRLSSGIFFFMALEALINLTYAVFLWTTAQRRFWMRWKKTQGPLFRTPWNGTRLPLEHHRESRLESSH